MFDKLVEQKIREAQEAGEFDDLEGAGRPVNLDAYFNTPEELRAGYALLKNAGVLPQEAVVVKELNEAAARLEACRDEAERERLRLVVRDLQLKYNLWVERNGGGLVRSEYP
ncbi:MAG TPA: DnaJ family domain-containing protein [Pyrinomonadaceae bacterium]|nr:DnaJ family domain-containing protein [Pyrinomonadaceae bacterium]